MYFGDRMRKETLVRHGFRLPSALDNRPLQEAECDTRVACPAHEPITAQSSLDVMGACVCRFWSRVQQCIFVSATPGDWEQAQSAKGGSAKTTELIIRPTGILDPVVETRPSRGQMDDLLPEILSRSDATRKVHCIQKPEPCRVARGGSAA